MPNILDKTDRSLLNKFPKANVTRLKRDVFNWCPGGTTGDFRQISKHDLYIDGNYQRKCISKGKVLEIARQWDWLLLGAISVVERDDGMLWVFDGGHRVRASFYRDDITLLPCMVHAVDTVSAEAKAFVAKNTMVSNVSIHDKHHASVFAGEPVAIKANAIIDDLELEVQPTPHGVHQISCIGAIRKAVGKDEELTKDVLGLCMELAIDEPVVASVFSGLFALCNAFTGDVDVLAKYRAKLSRFSQRELVIKIRQYRAEVGKGGETIYAKAILGVLNKGVRNKLHWPTVKAGRRNV